jgi:hypothetical protein
MTYHYTDASREGDPHALPDIEIVGPERQGECANCTSGAMYVEQDQDCDCCSGGVIEPTGESGFYYAYGFPGCLWDSDPYGPYNTEEEALTAARESAGL